MHLAAEFASVELVKFLVSCTRVTMEVLDADGYLPIHCAIDNFNSEVFTHLLSLGIYDASQRYGSAGDTLLHTAAMKGNVDALRALLLRDDVDINQRDFYGETPFHYAAKSAFYCDAASTNATEVAQIFLSHPQLDVLAEEENGRNALHYAVTTGHESMVRALLQRKDVTLNAFAKNTLNGLHVAARKGYVRILKMLLPYGVNSVNKQHSTPLHDAALRGQTTCVKALLGATGINVNAKDELNQTPIHNACRSFSQRPIDVEDNYEVVALLASDPRVDLHTRDNDGKTPLEYAQAAGYTMSIAQLEHFTKQRN